MRCAVQLCVTGSHPRPRTSHVVVKVSVSVKRKLDGMERTGRLFLVDLATPEAAIPAHYDVHMADDARDVAVAIYRLGIMRNNMHSMTYVVQYAGVPCANQAAGCACHSCVCMHASRVRRCLLLALTDD